jgi:aminoglycoside phosphotransferase (APT) family kinase protein
MEAVAADAIRFELPPAYSTASCRAIGEQAIDTLAALHAIEPASVGLAGLGRPSGYIARQLRRWRGQLEGARTRDTADLDAVADWLDAHIPADDQPARIVHGDYKLDNLLFGPERVAPLRAVVDWELATLGDPLADLGWLLAFWREAGEAPPILKILPRVTEASGFLTRAELAERYAVRSGRAVPDLRFHVALARWKLAVIVEAHWARHVRGDAGEFDFGYLETAGPELAASIRASL